MNEEIKKLIRNGLLFFMLFLIILLVLNMIYIEGILNKTLIHRKNIQFNEYMNNQSEKELSLAIFGDSHALTELNPRFIHNSYNFAISGESYIQTYYKLKKLIENDKIKIDNIILEIDKQTFSTKLTEPSHLLDEFYFYSDLVPSNEKKVFTVKSQTSGFIYSHFPVIGKGQDLRYLFISPEYTQLDFNGWGKRTENFSALNRTQIAESRYKELFEKQDMIDPVSFEYFIRTLKLVKDNNITLILIKYPISKELDKVIEEKGFKSEEYYEKLFRGIRGAAKEDYVFFDYYNVFENSPEYFSDSDHLNERGAEIFSKMVCQDLKKEISIECEE